VGEGVTGWAPGDHVMAVTGHGGLVEKILVEAPRLFRLPEGRSFQDGAALLLTYATTIHALLEFENGAVITLNASWDVWNHGHKPMELYGEEGTIHVPDPNFFGGNVTYTRQSSAVKKMPKWEHPLGVRDFGHASFPYHRTMYQRIAAHDPEGARAEALKLIATVEDDLKSGAAKLKLSDRK
jgi:predicted dehydrogenase